jgi:ABC-type nickel/cobalt efflux system permease component RcnA
MTITVVLLHLSALHLIWLFLVSIILSVLALMLPWIQTISLGIYLLISVRNVIKELETFKDKQEDEFFSEVGEYSRSKLDAMQPLFKGVKKEKPQGFG